MRKDALNWETDFNKQEEIDAEQLQNLGQDLIYGFKHRINTSWNQIASEETTERLNQILKENKLPQKLNTETYKVSF